MNAVIIIPGQDAVWRYDQIAAVELFTDTDTLSIVPVGAHGREGAFDYEYEGEDSAKAAMQNVCKQWKEAMAS